MPNQAGTYLHTPGPQALYVAFRNDNKPLLLGWAITSPEFEETPKYHEVYSDLGGRLEPFNLIYDGTSALVSVTANVVDLEVLRGVRDSGRAGGNLTGTDGSLSRGQLVLGRSDFSLIVKNQYYGTPNATPGLAPGRRYFSCTLAGYKESAAGTRSMEVALVFRAWNLFQGVGQGFRLFTEVAGELGV